MKKSGRYGKKKEHIQESVFPAAFIQAVVVSAAKVASRGRKENPKNNVKIYFIQDLQKRYSL